MSDTGLMVPWFTLGSKFYNDTEALSIPEHHSSLLLTFLVHLNWLKCKADQPSHFMVYLPHIIAGQIKTRLRENHALCDISIELCMVTLIWKLHGKNPLAT